jgi:hypothetical protein
MWHPEYDVEIELFTESNSTVSITRNVPVCRLTQVVPGIVCALSPGTREKGGTENELH